MATKKTTNKVKSVSTKTTRKKTISKKSAITKKPAVSAVNRRGLLLKLHIASIVDYILVVVAVMMFMAPTYFNITIPYTTTDPLLADAGLVAASRHFYTFDLRWILISLGVVSIVFSLLYVTKLKDFYMNKVSQKQLWSRWFELAITTALMLEGIALISGWTDFVQLKFVWFVAVALALLGYMQSQKANRQQKVAIWVTSIGVATLLGLSALMTYLYGMVMAEWHVYALYAAIVIVMIWYGKLLGNNQRNGIEQEKQLLITNIVTRVGFSAVLIIGLLK